MKKTIMILCAVLFAHVMQAQPMIFLQDLEQLFTNEEASKLDSLLRNYHNKTTHHVCVLSTDSMDLPLSEYVSRFAQSNGYERDGKGMTLLLSRKNQQLELIASNALRPFIKKEELMGILNAGIPSLREKRTANGVMEIFQAAMNYIDSKVK